jgi:tetratricopeptide (TPR) repeat protein
MVGEARLALGAQLAAHRQAAGETQRSLARKLPYSRSTIAGVETGRQHAPIAFWENCDELLDAGSALLKGYRSLEAVIRAQASERAETGAAAVRSLAPPGLGWQSTLNGAVVSVMGLSQESVQVPVCDLAPTTAAASGAATLRWLLAPLDRQPQRAHGHRLVGRNDVAAVMAMHQSLRQLDNTHGGGAVLHMALAYLRHDVAPLLHGRYSAGIGKTLFAATSQLIMALALMAYDAAHHDLARRAMIQALRLSHAARDRSFGGRVLVAMSHQALHLGAINEAIDLARAAAEGTRAQATPGAQAMFAASEARALAIYGDQRECQRLIGLAERAFNHVRAEIEPSWSGFIDEGELAGKFGRCFRDLGQMKQADSFLALSIQRHKPIYSRSRAITQLIWASTYVRQGELEEACRLGNDALIAIGPIRSERTRDYLRELHHGLAPHHRVSAVTGFLEQARPLLPVNR